MAVKQQLTISNPAIGGSGYLTLCNMEADAAVQAGFYVAIHQCRGLAQAGGPLCIDVVIREHEVKGSISHDVDYVNGFDLSEAWRVVNNVSDFNNAFPRGLTIVADFFVDVPILVTASRKGPRYLTRNEYLKKFKDLIDAGFDMRMVAYNFKNYKFQTILKGPFSLGVIASDLIMRNDDRFITLPKESIIEGILKNVPQKDGNPAYNKKILKHNREVFESGFAARNLFDGPRDEKIIII
jgi:Pyruvate/2-oxoacid:ferredoxin oxidoreductase gamma subunit